MVDSTTVCGVTKYSQWSDGSVDVTYISYNIGEREKIKNKIFACSGSTLPLPLNVFA